ncbi:MAG: hypothetical protein DRP47_12810 [Candidatus Zixiibacteriota bacterium]|nr:MAG: hypothetical protein DRP47_12810 [candidate division Zixibacteria bacterium]
MEIQDQSKNNRECLGFSEAVMRYIEPVLTQFGFRLVDTSCYVVSYQSSAVSLEVVHDLLSYDIGMEFRRLYAPSEHCTLGGILASVGEVCSFQASTPQRIDAVISRIADLLRKYGAGALNGDIDTYQRLVAEAKARSEAYTKKVVQEPIRTAAIDAWQKHDYAKVKELYESIGADLTAVEKKRLEYAKSHIR